MRRPAVTEFDTFDAAVVDRARLVADHLVAAAGRCRVTHLCDPTAVWARSRCVQLSATVTVCRFDGSAVRMTRRAVDVAVQPLERLTFAVPGCGGGTLWQGGWFRRLSPDDLVLVDINAPYDYRAGPGPISVVHVDPVALGVSAAVARTAAPRLRASPLHDLTRDHIHTLAGITHPPDPLPAVCDVGVATSLLLAALLLSCGVDAGR